MSHFPFALAALLAAPLAIADPLPPAEADPAPLVAGSTAFAIDLYRVLAEAEGNLCFSPYSVAIGLGMAEVGARGVTREEIARVLHLPEGDRAAMHAAWRSRLEPGQVAGAAAFEWSVANRLFHERGLAVEAEFLRAMREQFQAPPEAADFASDPERARARINDWVSGATRKKIVDLLAPGTIDALTTLVLVDAIHLKAQWAEAFRESETTVREFHAADGAVPAPFLRRTGGYRYAETAAARLVEIPYLGEALSMVVVLPREGLPELEKGLTAAGLAAAIAKLVERTVDLELPKFRFRSSHALVPALRRLGVIAAFDPQRADFTGIVSGGRNYVSEVAHQAFIAVDEKGTEAAVATAVVVTMGLDRDSEPTPFVADRPFLYLIRHRETGTPIFLGRVVDPR